MNLVIVWSAREVASAQRFARLEHATIVASGVDTFQFLDSIKVRYIKLSKFYVISRSHLWTIRNRAFQISNDFFQRKEFLSLAHPVLDIPLFIHQYFKYFLLTIIQDFEVATKILDTYQPTRVIFSNRQTEGLLRKTHHANFHLVNQLMRMLCQKRHIPHSVIPSFVEKKDSRLSVQCLKLFLEAIVNVLRPRKPQLPDEHMNHRSRKILISASHHQLTNLKTVIRELRKRAHVFTIGKLDRRDFKRINKSWNFFPINQISRVLSKRDLLININFAAYVFLRYLLSGERWKKSYFEKTLGIDCWSLIGPTLSYFFSSAIVELHRNCLLVSSLFRSHKFSFILTSNTMDPFNTALLNVARKKKIPYGLMVHDAQANTLFDYNFRPDDLFFVWGKYQKWIIQADLPRSTCVVVGNPQFDGFRSNRSATAHSILPKKMSLLILTCFNPYIQLFNAELLLNLLRTVEKKLGSKSVKFIIKGHPSDDHNVLKKIVEKTILSEVIFSTEDTDELIRTSDVVITQSTSAGVRAIIAKKPVIYLNIGEYKDFEPYATERAARGVYALSRLVPSLRALYRHPNSLRQGHLFIREYCFRLDGRAGERVAREVLRRSR